MPSSHVFTGITSEGGILPTDFLAELTSPKSDIEGLDPTTYRLAPGERIGDQVNRSWNRLKGCWVNFLRSIAAKQPGEPTTTETRERWLFPLFQELDFGRLTAARPIEVDGKSYPVSHGWGPVPIHLVGTHVDLDRRTPGAVGAAKASPHSLVQQVLNASDNHLWGIISNGYTLRLVRDNVALTRIAYLEWDLQAIFDGDLYPEFFLLWLVCHQSRFEIPPDGRPDQRWIEKWKKQAEEKGLRALENLRPGVEKAIASIGSGLVSHKANQTLRSKLSSGQFSTQEFYRQILRIIYRMLFLFVAEDRGLLHPALPGEDQGKETMEAALKARRRYRGFYSIGRLRDLTLHRAGTPHPDLWQVFQLVSRFLGSDSGCPELALPALGSFLWSPESTPDLNDGLVSNRNFLEAVQALAFIRDENVRRAIDYKNLGSEELGSVYESLLELHPIVNADAGTFELKTAAGHERKTTGSYYTDDSLVQSLLDSALEPVIAETIKGKEGMPAAEALLKLKICDLAVGSGHFLIGAAHRLAKRVAAARTGEEEPSPEATRSALREVIGRCLYGVDVNPMAAELCRVSLWLEALEPGKPLSFLDHHIRVGNSLLGATPELIAGGLPDEAFTAIEGDDKKACAVLKKRNKIERKGLGPLFAQQAAETQARLQQAAAALEELPDDRPEDIRAKELAFRRHEQTEEYHQKKQLADAWCAAFVIKKHFRDPGRESSASGITQGHLNDLASGRPLPAELAAEAERLSGQYCFFHWHLAFPEVFAQGGFDIILGNPPWERLKLQEKEWFADKVPEIATAENANHRRKLISMLKETNMAAYDAFAKARRRSEGETHFIHNSQRYPLCGRGDINTYALFAEMLVTTLADKGRAGIIVPTGIATDSTYQDFFSHLVSSERIISFKAFINSQKIFRDVKDYIKFGLLVLGNSQTAEYAFMLKNVQDLQDPMRTFSLSRVDFTLLNPNTHTLPTFRTSLDADLTKQIFRKVGVLVNERGGSDPWGTKFSRMFDMTNDSNSFATSAADEYLPLYEAKMVYQFDHRFSTYENATQKNINEGNLPQFTEEMHADPALLVKPHYWVPVELVQDRLAGKWSKKWSIGFRGITDNLGERTAIFTLLPFVGAGNSLPLLIPGINDPRLIACLLANVNSLVFDYVARQKIARANMNFFFLKQLPVLSPDHFDAESMLFIVPRVFELIYTANDVKPYADDLWKACDAPLRKVCLDQASDNRKAIRGQIDNVIIEPVENSCPFTPFIWNHFRRVTLRAELDSFFSRRYELNSEQLRYILDPSDVHGSAFPGETFRVLKEKEIRLYGRYLTMQATMEAFERS